jgi:hypothetical protein
MSDRERWIVYPLLLMALGMAAAPRFVPGNGKFEDLRCTRLYCNEVVTKKADVKVILDTGRMRLVDANGALQAELLATEKGGRLDLTRYAKAGSPPLKDHEREMYVHNAQRLQIPLGMLHMHVLPEEKPAAKEPEKPAEKSAEQATSGEQPAPVKSGQDAKK